MTLWNDASLQSPCMDLCKYKKADSQTMEEISCLVTSLTKAADHLGSDHLIWKEIQIFQSLQTRLASKLPCDKFLHIFQRVGHCIRKLVLLDLSKLYLDLADKFLSGILETSEVVMLPSCQQLEFLLIRTQGAAKLLSRTLNYSEDAFSYLLQRLSVGHLLQCLLMACSVVARISVMYKAMLVQLCDLYKEIKPWCAKLKRGKWNWPSDPEIPDDLWNWLGPERPEFHSDLSMAYEQQNILNRLFKRSTLDNVQDCCFSNSNDSNSNEEFTQEAEDSDCIEISTSNKTVKKNMKQNDDIGEVVSRSLITDVSKQVSLIFDGSKSVSPLKMILEAKTLSTITYFWKQLRCGKNSLFTNILPKPLTAKKKLKVESLLSHCKQSIKSEKERTDINRRKKKKNVRLLVISVRNSIISTLGLSYDRYLKRRKVVKKGNMSQKSKVSAKVIKPVTTLCKLRHLYETLKHKLTPTNYNLVSERLNCIYISGYNDAHLLKQKGYLKLSKKLIKRTSEEMISLCQRYIKSKASQIRVNKLI